MNKVCQAGLEPQTSRPQAGLLPSRLSLALDSASGRTSGRVRSAAGAERAARSGSTACRAAALAALPPRASAVSSPTRTTRTRTRTRTRPGRRVRRDGADTASGATPSLAKSGGSVTIFLTRLVRRLPPRSYILGDTFPQRAWPGDRPRGHHDGSTAGRHDAALPLDGGLVRCERARRAAPGEEGFRCVLAAGHSEDPPR